VIPTAQELKAGRTLAEIQGFTAEMGAAVASLAAMEAATGDLAVARAILELLSQVERRRGEPYTALLCAEAAARLSPGDRQVRLARAEALLAVPADAGTGGAGRREAARGDLSDLQAGADEVAKRAGALLRALGP
jgi:hypothetical protein